MASDFGIIHIGKDENKCKDPECSVCRPEDDNSWRAKYMKNSGGTDMPEKNIKIYWSPVHCLIFLRSAQKDGSERVRQRIKEIGRN